jgi:hypothetical protein
MSDAEGQSFVFGNRSSFFAHLAFPVLDVTNMQNLYDENMKNLEASVKVVEDNQVNTRNYDANTGRNSCLE